MRRLILVAALALIVISTALSGTEPVRSPKDSVIEFVAAFTRHDLPALLAFTHADIEWLTISESTVLIETRGQEALGASLRSYFDSCPTCQATVEVSSVNGNFVSAVETATWQSKEGVARAQSSLSVYEFVDGKIRRVWYYPAAKR